jgi:DNA-binding GntR family transcriptional regulator
MHISADDGPQRFRVDPDGATAADLAALAPAEPGFSVQVQRVAAPIRQQVLDQLREAIVTHRLRPGQRLVERELIEQTGVSRPTIREALRQLAAEGLVLSIPNKGTVVASLSTEGVQELYEIRAALESMAVRQFHLKATEAERAALRRAFDELADTARRHPDQPLLPLKERFYDALFAGARNSLLAEIVGGLQTRVTAVRATSLSQAGRPLEVVEEVGAIVDCLEAGDVQGATAACEYHVMQAAKTFFSAVGETADDTERE